jgi:hypothetical protein
VAEKAIFWRNETGKVSNFTFELWVKTPKVNKTYTLAGKGLPERPGNPQHSEFLLDLLPNDRLQAKIYSGTDNQNSIEWKTELPKSEISDDKWHLITVVYSKSPDKLSIYIDGVKKATTQKPKGFTTIRYNDKTRFYLGFINPKIEEIKLPGQAYFEGLFDEVRLWDFVRSEKDIFESWKQYTTNVSKVKKNMPNIRVSSNTNPGTSNKILKEKQKTAASRLDMTLNQSDSLKKEERR